jgi:hypothetical protein
LLDTKNNIIKGKLGEDFVNELAFHSFIKFWCYPSPKDEVGNKKEIIDLLITFKSVCILISVKNYEFKNVYDRYFRNTIDFATKQIQGAERKLFESNRDIYIKHPEKEIEKFEAKQYEKCIRIVVNLGANVNFYPTHSFTNKSRFVHIFNKDAFEQVITELDTIPDFIDYLEKREDLFKMNEVLIMPCKEDEFDPNTALQFYEYNSNKDPIKKNSTFISGTEYDLLAYFLKSDRDFSNLKSHTENCNMCSFLLDGAWDEFINTPQFKNKKSLDKNSYFIDEFIRREVLTIKDNQAVEYAKELLALDRFERRIITNRLFEFADKYNNKVGNYIARSYMQIPDLTIAFLFFGCNYPKEFSDIAIDLAMKGYCIYDNYKTKKLILIATTHDFQYFRIGAAFGIVPFPLEYENMIKEDLKELNWFTDIKTEMGSYTEYPE